MAQFNEIRTDKPFEIVGYIESSGLANFVDGCNIVFEERYTEDIVSLMRTSSLSKEFLSTLQCLSQTRATGEALLTSWINMEQFKNFLNEAKDSYVLNTLKSATMDWDKFGVNEIHFIGYKFSK